MNEKSQRKAIKDISVANLAAVEIAYNFIRALDDSLTFLCKVYLVKHVTNV